MVLETAQPKCVCKAKGKYRVLQQIKSNLGFDYLDSIFCFKNDPRPGNGRGNNVKHLPEQAPVGNNRLVKLRSSSQCVQQIQNNCIPHIFLIPR